MSTQVDIPIPSVDAESLESRVAALEQQSRQTSDSRGVNLLVFSNDLDRLLAAFVVATGSAASGMKVSMFFSFWGTAALKKRTVGRGKSLVERAFGMMLPGGIHRRKLSRLNMGGIGRVLMQREMKRKNIASLPELIDQAASLGVQIHVCEMSMDLMGIRREELVDYPGVEFCGVATFAAMMAKQNTSMFM